MKKLTDKQILEFYRKRNQIQERILNNLKQGSSIYGSYSLNKTLPKELRKYPMNDIDIYAKEEKVKQQAKEIEQALDKLMGHDAFYITKGKHNPSTRRIRAYEDDEVYADVTQYPKKLKTQIIGGRRYVTPNEILQHTNKVLKEQSATHRKSKDLSIKRKIEIFNRQNKIQKPSQITIFKPTNIKGRFKW